MQPQLGIWYRSAQCIKQNTSSAASPPPKHDFLDETLVTQVQIKYFIRVESDSSCTPLMRLASSCLPAEVHPQGPKP